MSEEKKQGQENMPAATDEAVPEPVAAGETSPESAAAGEAAFDLAATGETTSDPVAAGETTPDPALSCGTAPEPAAAGGANRILAKLKAAFEGGTASEPAATGETTPARNMLKWGVIAVASLAVLAILALGYFLYVRSQTVAIVNGERITKNELYETMLLFAGRDTLNNLIERRLVLQESRRLNFSVSTEEIDQELETVKELFESEEEFLTAMESYGYTMERLRDDISIDLLRKKIAKAEMDVSDATLEQFFNENRHLFDEQEKVRARHILVETEDKIKEVVRRLNEGEDFAALAKELSLDTGTKDAGGEWGFLERDGVPWPEVDEAIFSLQPGKRSEPVKSQSGYHVVEVLEKREPKPAVLADIKEKVKETMLEEEILEKIDEVMGRLRENAQIKNLIFKDEVANEELGP